MRRRTPLAYALSVAASPALAAAFPGRAVTIVVPFAAGGGRPTPPHGSWRRPCRAAQARPDGLTLLPRHICMSTTPTLQAALRAKKVVRRFREPVARDWAQPRLPAGRRRQVGARHQGGGPVRRLIPRPRAAP